MFKTARGTVLGLHQVCHEVKEFFKNLNTRQRLRYFVFDDAQLVDLLSQRGHVLVRQDRVDSVERVQVEALHGDLLEGHAEEAGHHADDLRRVGKHFLVEFDL